MGNVHSITSHFDTIQHLLPYLFTEEEILGRRSNRTEGNRHRNRGYALNEVQHLTDQEFLRMFRMSRAKFEELTLLIEDYMPDINEDMAKLSSGSTITNRTKLHVTLRWLAGGSYLDLCFGWGISIPSFYEICIWPTIDAIDQTFQIGLPLDDLNELKRMADEFSLYSRGQLWGCVTAIDGF